MSNNGQRVIAYLINQSAWLPGMILGRKIAVECSKTGTASIANNAILRVINNG